MSRFSGLRTEAFPAGFWPGRLIMTLQYSAEIAK